MALFRKYYAINTIEKLGSGTYGDVFLGTRRADNLQVAVKKIMRKTVDARVLEFIVAEVQILKELNHPHIIKIYDLYKDYEAYYLCLELVTGGELFARITKKTFYSELEARNTCKVILSALRHCHGKHVVHRDLKPENLLMQSETDDTSIKIIDFGFAAYAPEPTLKGICGTAIYMAPEIWKGELYGKPVDMWAFGVITYILLGGYPPFSDETRIQLTTQICAGKFKFHDEYWTDVSAQAKNFITQLLTVDVDQRMTVVDALKHPWLALSAEELAEHNLSSGLKELKKFNSRRKIRAVIKTVLAMKRFERILMSKSGEAAEGTTTPRSEAPTVEVENTHHVKFNDAVEVAVVPASSVPKPQTKKSSGKCDDTEFDRLVKTYSTCYEDVNDDIPDEAEPVAATPGPFTRAASTHGGRHLTGALSMYQGTSIKALDGLPPIPPSPARAATDSAGVVADAITKLEATNADLEAVIQQLTNTISGHRDIIAKNKSVIESLRKKN